MTHLRTLRDAPYLTAAMGMAARRRVEQNYSLNVTVPILAEIINELLGSIVAHKA